MKLARAPFRKPLSQDDKQKLCKHLVEQVGFLLVYSVFTLILRLPMAGFQSRTTLALEGKENTVARSSSSFILYIHLAFSSKCIDLTKFAQRNKATIRAKLTSKCFPINRA